MKVNELRIGNYVKSKRHDLDVVTQVGKSNVWGKFNEDIFPMPMPLTEEWLMKFGFEPNSNNQYRLKSRLIVIRDGVFTDYGSNVQLINVHQLQNFYFALTGEELTIK